MNRLGIFDASEEALAREMWEFKQCQRTDGSIYGVSDKSSCAQKGSKEVSKKQKNHLFSNSNTNSEGVGIMVNSLGKGPETFSPSELQIKKHVDGTLSKVKQASRKMTEGDLRATIQNSKKAIETAEKKSKKLGSNEAAMLKKGVKEAVEVLYDELAKRQKAEGKKPETLTSMLSGENLKKIGL